MTDKQIIDTLQNIRTECRNRETHNVIWDMCKGCPFCTSDERGDDRCQITWLLGNLSSEPRYWSMEKIERIINETD